MTGKRPPWMFRAVAGSLIGLIIAGAFTVGVLWLYDHLEPVAPGWMTRYGLRSMSLLSLAALFGWMAGLGVIFALVSIGLVRVLRVPVEAIAPFTGAPDYPEHLRPPSPEVRTRAGREGFVDARIAQRDPEKARRPD